MAEDNELLLKERVGMSRYSPLGDEVHSPKADKDINEKRCGFNRRAFVMFFGVTTIAVAVLISAVVLTVYSGGGVTRQRRGDRGVFEFKDIFSGKYQPNDMDYNWIKDPGLQAENKYISRNHKSADIVLTTLDSAGKTSDTILLASSSMEDLGSIQSYWLSPDQQFLLIATNSEQEYRYSYYADYYIHQINSKGKPRKLVPPGEEEQIYYAAWNKRGHSMVYVYKNNIYFISDSFIMTGQGQQLTYSGEKHKIFNGIPDWVYQEEVLNKRYASWFSLDGKFLCYIEFNDTFVQWYEYPWYGDSKNSYPSLRKIAYPKSGTPNPTVSVKLIDLSTGKISPFFSPISGEHYVTTVAWSPDNKVYVTWVNRDQNVSVVTACTTYPLCKELNGAGFEVKGGWIDSEYHAPVFDISGVTYFTLRPSPQGGNAGSFIHLVSMNLQVPNSKPYALTSGKWEVTKILAYDDKRTIIYFESTEVSPMQRHIYSYDVLATKKTCLTCELDSHKSGECNYFRASFSLKGFWFTLHCQGPGVPRTTLHSTKTNPTSIVKTLTENVELRKNLQDISLPKVEYFTVKSDGYDIQAKAVYPPTFDSSKAGKYAVLFDVYGGPASQKVVQTFGFGWGNGYLVSNYDVILVTCDARGSGYRGESFKHAIYKQLGIYEARDTIAVGRYMADRSYVNEDKIAIWGWSYGGFLTSYILGQHSGVFNLGMAVAPVTDWRYYDSIYTERYMLTPQENPKGYKESSVISLVKDFKDIKYLLVHGTGDDNVHFQNSAQLVKELTRAEVKYRVQYYTDKNHGLSGGGTSEHLYHLLTDFLVDGLMIGFS